METYYLRKYLDLRPETTGTVEADLPEETAMSSDGSLTTLSKSTDGKNKQIKKKGNDMMEALRVYQECLNNSEFTQQRLSSLRLEETRRNKEEIRKEEEDNRRKNDEIRKQEEATRRNNEEIRKQDDHKVKKQKSSFDEWEKIQENLRSLRNDLISVVDDELREEINDDIKALKTRKNTLAIELGYK